MTSRRVRSRALFVECLETRSLLAGDVQAVKYGNMLVIWGDADRVIPASHAQFAPAGAAVVVIEGAGHMVQMEKASEVNALLQQHSG